MAHEHSYRLTVEWTGNRGSGTSGYRDFARAHQVSADGKPDIAGSADPTFRGDKDRWNPEELLVAALSECHMLAFLHMATRAGVVVTGYLDHPEGTMRTSGLGGEFTEVVLHPQVTLADPAQAGELDKLHDEAHHNCFIARSVNFPVRCEPR